jgi:hypothetical protein
VLRLRPYQLSSFFTNQCFLVCMPMPGHRMALDHRYECTKPPTSFTALNMSRHCFTALLLCVAAYGVSATHASCQIKIDGVCKKYPQMPNGRWFEDSNGGGPVATTAAACLARDNNWKVACGVNVEYKFTPGTTPPGPAPPGPAPGHACTGSSASLNPVSCAAWQDLAKATNITGWTKCSGNLLDPCSCNSGYNHSGWLVYVTCLQGDIRAL